MICSVEPFKGERLLLMPLFALADDSSTQIGSYIELGDVLVARRGGQIVGHVLVIRDDSRLEIKSLAVMESERGRGVGSALIKAALDVAIAAGIDRVVVAAAVADLANLHFYQRRGFRMDFVERDAFTTAKGYSTTVINGIPLRDRVWLTLDIAWQRSRDL